MSQHNLILRPFKTQDISAYHELSHSSGDIAFYFPYVVARDQNGTANLFYEQFLTADFERSFAFIIELTDENGTHPIGAIFADLDDVFDSLNVSFFISLRYRRMGYMKEALKKFISFAKHETPFYSFVFDIRTGNDACKQLIKSLGGVSLGDAPMTVFKTYERFEIVAK